ncbi:MAG: hypothetical protein ABL932_25895 [Terricaulis sp.]
MTSDVEPKQRWLRVVAMAGIGAVVGYFASQTIIDVVRNAALSWADFLALFLAVTLTAQGLFVLLLSLSRRASGSVFGGPGAKPASDAQLSFYREQGGVLLLAGVMLAVPVMLALYGGDPPARDLAIATMAGIVVARMNSCAGCWRKPVRFASGCCKQRCSCGRQARDWRCCRRSMRGAR